MQCFLPYPDFEESARVLDYRRLGKQRVECLQIFRCLNGKESRWKNHPAVLMWKGCAFQFSRYSLAICSEWIKRGFRDSCFAKIEKELADYRASVSLTKPSWLGDDRLHSSHRAALLYKDYEWYSQFGWKEEPKIDYYWPVRKNENI